MKKPNRSQNDIPNLSAKEAAILDLLLNRPCAEMYGLELVQSSRNKLKRGTVYVTLSRMQEKGYVESRLEEQKTNVSGLPRRLYRVTGYGQRVYEACQLAREALRLRIEGLGGAL